MRLKILKFGAEWCAPCRRLDQMDFPWICVDADIDTGSLRLHRVTCLPTLIFLKDEQEVARLTGSQTERSIRQIIEIYL